MFKRFKDYVIGASIALGSLAYAAASSFAQETTLAVADLGVDASTVSSSLGTSIKPWVIGGLGIAIGVFVVKIGWRWIKQFAR